MNDHTAQSMKAANGCLHSTGARDGKQYIGGGVHLTRDEFLAPSVPDSGRKTAARIVPQQSVRG